MKLQQRKINAPSLIWTSTMLAITLAVGIPFFVKRQQRKRESSVESSVEDSTEAEIKRRNIVSYSSCMIAASRALESERSDALILDPLAAHLAGELAIREKRKRQKNGTKESDTTWRIAIRTKDFDDFVLSAIKANSSPMLGSPLSSSLQSPSKVFDEGVIMHQVVLLGAGMDSRAYRLNVPSNIMFYEIDNAEVLALKDEFLTATLQNPNVDENIKGMIKNGSKRRKAITCNVEKDDGQGWKQSLLHAGFDPFIPTCWVMEGLTYYLDNQSIVAGMFRAARMLSLSKQKHLGSENHLIVSIASEKSVEQAQNSSNQLMKSWKWGTDRPDVFLSSEESGRWDCQPKDVVALGDPAANYGRFQPSEKSTSIRQTIGKSSGIMYVKARC